MATYDRTHGNASLPGDAGVRSVRHLRLDWSGLFGGVSIGWGVLLLLSLIGITLGLSVIDPFASRPAASNAGAALWGALSAVISSFIGGFAVVRLAGDRRRGESLVHGAVAWGMSMLLAAAIALFAAGFASFSRTPVRNTAAGRSATGRTAALISTTGNGPAVAISATAGAVLALVGSLLGAVAAASRSGGVPFSEEFRIRHRGSEPGKRFEDESTDLTRDETTILPPTH
jgi:amino acid permease